MLQKLAGITSILQAFIYIGAFSFFGAYWAFPAEAIPAVKLAYLAENQLTLSLISMLLVASLFGAVWVSLVIASGMILNTGLAHAFDSWVIFSVIVESIGGGNELTGGVWVLLISLCALKSKALPKGSVYTGLFVGVAGLATVYPDDVLTEIFGLTQIVWFLCLGIILLKSKSPAQACR